MFSWRWKLPAPMLTEPWRSATLPLHAAASIGQSTITDTVLPLFDDTGSQPRIAGAPRARPPERPFMRINEITRLPHAIDDPPTTILPCGCSPRPAGNP